MPDDFPSQIKDTRSLALIKKYNVKLYSSKAISQEEFIQRMKNTEVVVNVRAYSKFIEEAFQRYSSLKLLSIDSFLKLNNVTLIPHHTGMTQKKIEKDAQRVMDDIINPLQGALLI